VAACAFSHTISVLSSLAGGGFARQDFTVGILPRSVTVGDIDADGDLDILTANAGQNNGISILLNNGAGSFFKRLDVPVGSKPPRAAKLADVDGDGDLDIVTASYEDNSVAVLIVKSA
jgi:hypothetical protein